MKNILQHIATKVDLYTSSLHLKWQLDLQGMVYECLTCIPDDVIEDHQLLKLFLELFSCLLRQGVHFPASQHTVCIWVIIHKRLEWPYL